MPRMYAASTVSDPEKGVPASSVTFGATALSFATSLIPFDFELLDVTAVTAIGTSWRFSERRVAVTVTCSSSCAMTAFATSELTTAATVAPTTFFIR